LKVSEAAFAGGSPDCRALVERYRIHEEELASTPLLREGLAQTLACLNQRPQAIEQMRLAFAQRQELIKTGQLPPREIGPWFGSLNYVFRSPQTGMVDAAAVEQLVQEMTNGKPELFHLRALAMTWLTGGGSPSRAIELQQRALDACPPDEPRLKMDLLVEMASYQLTARQFRGAVEAYQALLEHDPNHRDALNNLAFLLAEELNEPARAVTYALRALEIDPSNANILDTVGRSYFLAGDLENARTYLQRSIDERRTLEASVHMAELLVKVGDFAGAQRQVAEARRFKHDEATRDKLERLTDEINRGRASGAAR
jgi:tetratricopeptide (TPR) repeat protein